MVLTDQALHMRLGVVHGIAESALIRPALHPRLRRTSPAPGALWPVSTWERPPHDAGGPRYTHARAPHARGWFLLATGTTRPASV